MSFFFQTDLPSTQTLLFQLIHRYRVSMPAIRFHVFEHGPMVMDIHRIHISRRIWPSILPLSHRKVFPNLLYVSTRAKLSFYYFSFFIHFTLNLKLEYLPQSTAKYWLSLLPIIWIFLGKGGQWLMVNLIQTLNDLTHSLYLSFNCSPNFKRTTNTQNMWLQLNFLTWMNEKNWKIVDERTQAGR